MIILFVIKQIKREVTQYSNITNVSPSVVTSKLQVDPINWSDCKVRIQIRNIEINNDVSLSLCRKNLFTNYFETATRAYPEFGIGGELQYESRLSVNITHLDYWDGLNWVSVY